MFCSDLKLQDTQEVLEYVYVGVYVGGGDVRRTVIQFVLVSNAAKRPRCVKVQVMYSRMLLSLVADYHE